MLKNSLKRVLYSTGSGGRMGGVPELPPSYIPPADLKKKAGAVSDTILVKSGSPSLNPSLLQNEAQRKEDDLQTALRAIGFKMAIQEPPVKTPFTEISVWQMEYATMDNTSNLYNTDQAAIDSFGGVKGVSQNLKKQFDLTRSTALMFRETNLNLLRHVKESARREKGSPTIILDGPKGVGKSCALLSLANHLKLMTPVKKNETEGWILLYFPNITSWTTGKYEYESRPADNLYVQSTLSSKLLEDIIAMNPIQLSLVPSPVEGFKNLRDFCQSGVGKFKVSSVILERVLDFLCFENNGIRQNVLLAIDNANALYSISQYHSKESIPLPYHSFVLGHKLQKLLSADSSKVSQGLVRIGAMEFTNSLIRSSYLEKVLNYGEKVKKISGTGHTDVDLGGNEFGGGVSAKDFEPIEGPPGLNLDVLLPDVVDKMKGKTYSPPDEFNLEARELVRFIIPAFNLKETEKMIDFYKASKFISKELTSSDSQEQQQKMAALRVWMETQGNPLEILRSSMFFDH